MRVIQVYGFGDTGVLLTVGLNRLGVECDLVLNNKQFAGQLPSWTKNYPELEGHVYVHRTEDARDPSTVVGLARFVNSYDLAHLQQPSSIYGDMIHIPFHIWDGGSSRFIFPPTKVDNPPVLADKAAARRTYKRAKMVHATDIDMYYKLFLPQRERKKWWSFWRHDWLNTRFTALPCDTDLFKPMSVPRDDKFTIYLPARQENQVKGTYDILDGIRLFLFDKNVDRSNVQVLMPIFGMDAPLIPHWVKDLGLDDVFKVFPLLPKPEFAKALNACDVVVDQLRLGALGGLSVQAMSCAKTVIVNAWRPWYEEQLGDVPPILYAKTAFDVSAQLLHAYDFYERQYWQMGKAAREYVVRHHDYMRVAEDVLSTYH